ncbi:MAG: hypothetical protein WC619_03015 [Patescibacteria group bacterium]
MNLLVNGIETRVSTRVIRDDGVPRGVILAVKVRCAGGRRPQLFNRLVAVFSRKFNGVRKAKKPKRGFIGFSVLGCRTELEAIDFLRSKGFGVVQQLAY